jgi:hypothetical protein
MWVADCLAFSGGTDGTPYEALGYFLRASEEPVKDKFPTVPLPMAVLYSNFKALEALR